MITDDIKIGDHVVVNDNAANKTNVGRHGIVVSVYKEIIYFKEHATINNTAFDRYKISLYKEDIIEDIEDIATSE